ncbi:hypothetical protein J0B03_05860 [Alkalibacter rhizosphaerae]|uniref:RCK N-terminal domain-containing protein n=1 Tax=Alkalibacter rhizosphaerae TaxID=2815577 RepID=A0A974XGR7_9FIRM|nr:hypothetical protein [Alkalibacter rhizosphaerae]QSX09582.1 hypothetical protein J0B03_05860 [Alkalibacter rhizosphaerae]
MDVALTLLLTGLFLYIGYVVMGRIDASLQGDSFQDQTQKGAEHVMLLYLDEQTPVSPSIMQRTENWTVVPMFGSLTEIFTPFESMITYSTSDLDNLLCINHAIHRQPDCFIAARCNDLLYENLYKSVGAQLILTGDTSLEQALDHMKGRN